MKLALRILAIIATSPIWLGVLAIALPFAIVLGFMFGTAQLLNYAVCGEWIEK